MKCRSSEEYADLRDNLLDEMDSMRIFFLLDEKIIIFLACS